MPTQELSLGYAFEVYRWLLDNQSNIQTLTTDGISLVERAAALAATFPRPGLSISQADYDARIASLPQPLVFSGTGNLGLLAKFLPLLIQYGPQLAQLAKYLPDLLKFLDALKGAK